MNAAVIWIIFPLIVSIVAWFFREYRRVSIFVVGILCGFLAIFAFSVRLGTVFSIGPISLEIDPIFSVLGRNFSFQDGDRYFLGLLYGAAGLWFFGSRISGSNTFFIPNGLAMVALLISALTIQPFLFAAFFIELAVLVSIPILIKPGEPARHGILRYLIFQTMAVPFILLAGWGFEQAPLSIDSQRQYFQAAILLGLGFSFWLAVFPFYTWVPLLAGEGQPYASGFIFSLLPTTALILIMEFFNNYAWLRDEAILFSAVRLVGTIMIITGGLWSAFQRSLARLFGYAVIVEIGFALLALSLQNQSGWEAYILAMIPRVITIALFALAIAVFRIQKVPENLSGLQGVFYRFPFVTLALLVSWFTFCGLPLLGSFPARISILSSLAQQNLSSAIWSGLGSFGLFFAGFRMLSNAFRREAVSQISSQETRLQAIFLSIGVLISLIIGLIPTPILGFFLELLNSFNNLI